MENLDRIKNGDFQNLRKNEASRWVGTDIVKTNSSTLDLGNLKLDPAMKEKLILNQTKINRLWEEKARMEKEAFPYIDELDIL